MIGIYERLMSRRDTLAEVATFADAKAKVEAMGVAFLEDDADHADCADAFMNDGRLITIQPVDFKMTEKSS